MGSFLNRMVNREMEIVQEERPKGENGRSTFSESCKGGGKDAVTAILIAPVSD